MLTLVKHINFLANAKIDKLDKFCIELKEKEKEEKIALSVQYFMTFYYNKL